MQREEGEEGRGATRMSWLEREQEGEMVRLAMEESLRGESSRRAAPIVVMTGHHYDDDVSEITEAFTLPICTESNWIYPPSSKSIVHHGTAPNWDHQPLYEETSSQQQQEEDALEELERKIAAENKISPLSALRGQESTRDFTRDGTSRAWLAQQQEDEFLQSGMDASLAEFQSSVIGDHGRDPQFNSAADHHNNNSYPNNSTTSHNNHNHEAGGHRRTRSAGWDFASDEDLYQDKDPSPYCRPSYSDDTDSRRHFQNKHPGLMQTMSPRNSLLDDSVPDNDPLHYDDQDDYQPGYSNRRPGQRHPEATYENTMAPSGPRERVTYSSFDPQSDYSRESYYSGQRRSYTEQDRQLRGGGQSAPFAHDRIVIAPRTQAYSEDPISDDRVITSPHGKNVYSRDRMAQSSYDHVNKSRPHTEHHRMPNINTNLRYAASNHETSQRPHFEYDQMSQSHYDDRHRGRYSPTPHHYGYDNHFRRGAPDLYSADRYQHNNENSFNRDTEVAPAPLSDSRRRSKSPLKNIRQDDFLVDVVHESTVMNDDSNAEEFIENFHKTRAERRAQRRAQRRNRSPVPDRSQEDTTLYPSFEPSTMDGSSKGHDLPPPLRANTSPTHDSQAFSPSSLTKRMGEQQLEDDVPLPTCWDDAQEWQIKLQELTVRSTNKADRHGGESLQGGSHDNDSQLLHGSYGQDSNVFQAPNSTTTLHASHGQLPMQGSYSPNVLQKSHGMQASHGHNSMQSFSGSSKENDARNGGGNKLSPRLLPGRSNTGGSRLANIEAEEKLRKFEQARAKLGGTSSLDTEADEKLRKFEMAQAKLTRPGTVARNGSTGSNSIRSRIQRSRTAENGMTMFRSREDGKMAARAAPEQRGVKNRAVSGDFGGRVGNQRSPIRHSDRAEPAATTTTTSNTGGVADILGPYRNPGKRHGEAPEASYHSVGKMQSGIPSISPIPGAAAGRLGRTVSMDGECATPCRDSSIPCPRDSCAPEQKDVVRPTSPCRRTKSNLDEAAKPARGRLFKKFFHGGEGKKGQGNPPASN